MTIPVSCPWCNLNKIITHPESYRYIHTFCLLSDEKTFSDCNTFPHPFFFCCWTQIAGSYPGVTREDYFAVTSEETPVQGQWTYDFSDPDGPQLGTVAIESSNVVACCEDPIVLIAEHTSIGVPLPEVIKEPVDIIVLCDRAVNTFAERKFLVLDSPSNGVTIGAFPSRTDLPSDSKIIGQVVLCQVPWLPSMKPTRTGFLEADEYF